MEDLSRKYTLEALMEHHFSLWLEGIEPEFNFSCFWDMLEDWAEIDMGRAE